MVRRSVFVRCDTCAVQRKTWPSQTGEKSGKNERTNTRVFYVFLTEFSLSREMPFGNLKKNTGVYEASRSEVSLKEREKKNERDAKC